MSKEEVARGIFADDSINREALNEMPSITPADWLDGVKRTLRLLAAPPCSVSKAILDAIAEKGKVTIIPSPIRALGPEKEFGNAFAKPVNSIKATAKDRPTEDDPLVKGVGGGSASQLEFIAQDWQWPGTAPTFKAVDEVLLHELVHSLRQNLGQEDNTPLLAPFAAGRLDLMAIHLENGPRPTGHTQVYQNLEEFVAILITNVYRSENLRKGLVRDHLGRMPRRGEPQGKSRDPDEETRSLGFPLTNPRNFLTMWRPQIERIYMELSVNGTSLKIGQVRCAFNPLFELFLERTKPVARASAH
jgi:hypothetical protein